MKPSACSRRAFLRGVGGGAGLVPLLHARASRAALAFPRRLIVVTQPNGIVHDAFWPQGAGSDLAGMTFPAVSKPLEKHRDRLVFVPDQSRQRVEELIRRDHDVVMFGANVCRHLRRISGELLSQCDRRCVLRMCPPDFDDLIPGP